MKGFISLSVKKKVLISLFTFSIITCSIITFASWASTNTAVSTGSITVPASGVVNITTDGSLTFTNSAQTGEQPVFKSGATKYTYYAVVDDSSSKVTFTAEVKENGTTINAAKYTFAVNPVGGDALSDNIDNAIFTNLNNGYEFTITPSEELAAKTLDVTITATLSAK